MKFIQKNITDKKNILKLLLFIFLFSIVFLIIYTPFDAAMWFKQSEKGTVKYFAYILVLVVSGIFVLAVSRFFMYLYNKEGKLSYIVFAVWIILELVIIAAIYTSINVVFFDDPRNVLDLFGHSFFYISLLVLIPYGISFLYFSLQEKRAIINELKTGHKDISDNEFINFTDDKGVQRLSVRLDNILYVEAAENYVGVNFIEKDEISKVLVKNTINKVEEAFNNKGLLRCHRSYIININKVEIIKKEKNILLLILNHPLCPNIPISKTYSDNIVKTFSINN